MRAYVMTTGAIFGLIAIAHFLRMLLEDRHLATDPWYVLLTAVALVLFGWAVRLLWLAKGRSS